jgi:hypothetical protein
MVHLYEDTSNFDAIDNARRDNYIIDSDIKNGIVTAYEKTPVINDAIEACSKAWDLLEFVDIFDSVEADIELQNLRNMWQNHFRNLEELKSAMEQLQRSITNMEKCAEDGLLFVV